MADPTFAEELRNSPELFPFAIQLDRDTVDFRRLSRTDYTAASFLDVRMGTSDTESLARAWKEVRAAALGLPPRCHFIFHISHVGSTLLSRLLGDVPGLFSLREPAILRNLADIQLRLGRPESPWDVAEFDKRLAIFLGLWSRTFERGDVCVIKATSFASELSERLMQCASESRAILMVVSPVTFLAALLDGAMSDITKQAERRLRRLHRRLETSPWQVSSLSPGECVAMSWLSEILSLHAAAARYPDRVLWLDFDRFLADAASGLTASLCHLGVSADAALVDTILHSPTLQHYAKKPEFAYNAQTRAELLRRSSRMYEEEIKRGLGWLQRARQFPRVAAAIDVVQAAVKRPFPR